MQPSTTKPLRLTEMHMVVVCTCEGQEVKGKIKINRSVQSKKPVKSRSTGRGQLKG